MLDNDPNLRVAATKYETGRSLYLCIYALLSRATANQRHVRGQWKPRKAKKVSIRPLGQPLGHFSPHTVAYCTNINVEENANDGPEVTSTHSAANLGRLK